MLRPSASTRDLDPAELYTLLAGQVIGIHGEPRLRSDSGLRSVTGHNRVLRNAVNRGATLDAIHTKDVRARSSAASYVLAEEQGSDSTDFYGQFVNRTSPLGRLKRVEWRREVCRWEKRKRRARVLSNCARVSPAPGCLWLPSDGTLRDVQEVVL